MAHNSKETNDTNFFGIGLHNPKNPFNIGAVLRAAGCFNSSFVAASGNRYKENKGDFRNMDTEFARKRIPLFLGVNSILDFVPYDAEIVVLERTQNAISLNDFQHPRRAFYIYGPEDGCVPTEMLQNHSFTSVYIPSNGSLNLASACYITLYDRQVKSHSFAVESTHCPNCNSNHIKTVSELNINGEMIYHCNACGNEWKENFV
jgi:tRNA(Leu) C34 or U34 (ribose-2'-O)-methylase TrmL